jgi:hypothetical protein
MEWKSVLTTAMNRWCTLLILYLSLNTRMRVSWRTYQ